MTATLPPLPAPGKPYNPWRESIENVITGGNYLCSGEFRELLSALDEGYAAIDALAAIAAQAQPASQVPMQSFADRVKNGIADYISDNMPMRRYDLAEIDALIRSVEIRADRVAATPPAVQPVQPTPLTDDQIAAINIAVGFTGFNHRFSQFVRAIELAHGISAPVVPTLSLEDAA